ncbi:MAG: hypothetical protein ACLFR2_09700 [Candidatus Kapaibacterium sp.]
MRKFYTRLIIIVSFTILTMGIVNELQSRPQYSILKTMGTKCTSCHVNPNYGGQRNFVGWLSSQSMTLVEPEDIGLGGFYDALHNSNSIWDDRIMFGLDLRVQNARWAQTSKLEEYRREGEIVKPTLERKSMLMQFMPYVKVNIADWVSIDGGYNFSYDIHDDMRYQGQQPGWASATFKVNDELPTLRVGFFPPPISVDYDDHTLLIRQVAGQGRSQPLIPADYAELGASLNYNSIPWLDVSLGVFESKNLAEMMAGPVPVVLDNSLGTVANVSFHPTLPYGMNTFFGVSHYVNGKLNSDDGLYYRNDFYYISSVFFNIGLSDRVALMTEYIMSEKQSIREVSNYLVEITYQLTEPVNVFFRYEDATTDDLVNDIEFKANQYVLGAHIFPLPYIDILPEYRIYDRSEVDGYSSQVAVQLHIFY